MRKTAVELAGVAATDTRGGLGSGRLLSPTRPSNSRSLRPHRLGPIGPELVNSPVYNDLGLRQLEAIGP
jgi:hypothetical protein